MGRRSTTTAQRAGLIAVAVALAGALAATGARLAGRASGGRLSLPGGGRRREGSGTAPEETYTCDCGKEYRVSGTDRHRVYWPAGAPENDPVLGDRCVQCDAPLPAGRAEHTV